MALPVSGKISLGDVRTVLKTTGPISLGQKEVRNLAEKTSGTIKMSDLHGKSAAKWTYVGEINEVKHTALGEPTREAIIQLRYQCENAIVARFGVSIVPEYREGSVAYSSDGLARAETTKAIQEHIGHFRYTLIASIYKFQ